MRKITPMVAVVLALGLVGSARGAESPTSLRVLSEGPGSLHRADRTVQFVVHSRRTESDLLVQVTPPQSSPWLPGQKAAAAYVLDGGYGIFAQSAVFSGAHAALPAYIVTVQYPPGQRGDRERDMLFAAAARSDGSPAKGGGAEAFIAFLVEELRPFIEARYPVDPGKSILVGHSLAGTFTANVLARRPEAFAGYIIASPSVWADPSIVERLARAPAAAPSPPRVFVAYGGAEAPGMISGGRKLAAAVVRNRPAFTSKAQVFRDASHISYYPELAARGLGYLLPRRRAFAYPDPIAVPAEALRRYEGAYLLSDGRRVEVALKGDRLTTVMAFPVELSALPKPGRFFVDGPMAQFTFEGPRGAPPNLLRIDLDGEQAVARRAP